MKSWLRKRNYYAREDAEMTHCFMDGGHCAIPIHARDDFYREYCRLLKGHHARLFIVELKSAPFFPFFLDLDFPWKMEPPSLAEMTTALQESVLFFGPLVVTGSNHGEKWGFHFHWPRTIVTERVAIQKGVKVVALLNRHFPTIPWSKVIDARVFKGSGCRMAGSWKMVFDHEKATYCPVPRIYNCMGYFREETGRLDRKQTRRLEGNLLSLLQMTTVRYWHEQTVEREEEGKKKRTCRGIVRVVKEKEKYAPIALYFKECCRCPCDGPAIMGVKRFRDKLWGIHLDCVHCQNKAQPHNSPHVWYLYDRTNHRMRQQCYCPCEDKRGLFGVPCSRFRGSWMPVPEKYRV